jgi:hypothetical protein
MPRGRWRGCSRRAMLDDVDWTRVEAGHYTGTTQQGETATVQRVDDAWLWGVSDANGITYATGTDRLLADAQTAADASVTLTPHAIRDPSVPYQDGLPQYQDMGPPPVSVPQRVRARNSR